MRVILTAGGSGGHVNPALAIADIIKQNDPTSEIIFIGTKNGIENRLVSKEGYEIKHVEARGFQRSLSLSNFAAAWYYFTSPSKAKRIIKEFNPDIVIGTGGYACYAPVKAAASLGIPTVLHESNALPGLAVRMLQHKVDRILLNFKESEKLLDAKEKLVTVGNPIRGEFSKYTKESARRELNIPEKYKYILLSYGGSLGAPAINDAALEIMKGYMADHPEVLHIHATGRSRYDEFKKRFDEAGLANAENIELCDYLYDMPKRLSAADVVISRAGAMTVTEMARMKKPCIMIPSPHVADNHQYKNAKVLADADAVVLVEESGLSGLSDIVKELFANKALQEKLSRNIEAFAGERVEEKIYKELAAAVKQK